MAAKRPTSRVVAIAPLLATRDDHPGLQSRAWMNEAAVASFAEDMLEGATFPPVSIIEDDAGNLYLWDGWHRVEAALSLERQTIAASVEPGTLDHALERALGANQAHGIRRTNEDKQSAIRAAFALMDRRGEEWSDGLIAEKCGVSRPTVANWRERNRGNMQSLHVGAKRIGRDGRVRKATYDRPLSALEMHVAAIDRVFREFTEVSEALDEIRERGLYRATHATFEDDCREQWGEALWATYSELFEVTR